MEHYYDAYIYYLGNGEFNPELSMNDNFNESNAEEWIENYQFDAYYYSTQNVDFKILDILGIWNFKIYLN